jgi:hypothetical protein
MPAKKETSTSSQKPLLPTDKIPLPAFLKMLTDGGVSMKNAMAVAAKVYAYQGYIRSLRILILCLRRLDTKRTALVNSSRD